MSGSGKRGTAVTAVMVIFFCAHTVFPSARQAMEPSYQTAEQMAQVRTCIDCHGEERFLPSYHKPAGKWKRRHGHRVNTMVRPDRTSRDIVKPGHVYDCNACHVDDRCRKCHQLNRPDSHTGFWRIRGHGIVGMAERDSCAYCHVESFCVRCHRTTRPINHVGKWRTNHGLAVAAGGIESCWICHPKRIMGVHVGNAPRCLPCHPR
jgi:hypothetical protein